MAEWWCICTCKNSQSLHDIWSQKILLKFRFVDVTFRLKLPLSGMSYQQNRILEGSFKRNVGKLMSLLNILGKESIDVRPNAWSQLYSELSCQGLSYRYNRPCRPCFAYASNLPIASTSQTSQNKLFKRTFWYKITVVAIVNVADSDLV